MGYIFKLCPKMLIGMSIFPTTDETRYNIAMLSFVWSEKELEIVGTDGHCLGRWVEPLHSDNGTIIERAGKAVIPIRAFLPVLRVAALKANVVNQPQVELIIDDPFATVKLEVEHSGFLMMARAKLAETDFPNWREVVPAQEKFKPIPGLGVNSLLIEKFQKAAPLLGASYARSANFVKLQFTGEHDVVEVRLGGLFDNFVGYLMPAKVEGGAM